MGENIRPRATVWVDEGTYVGEALSALTVHLRDCKYCGTKIGATSNYRLCVLGEKWLRKACAHWVDQGHFRNTQWMVENCV